VLLLGVPGCGKSLSAKAVAAEWHMPLLKLDPSNLYNKYIGDSERNFKRAMRTAEKVAPVVLWIDELEKAFATGGVPPKGSLRRDLRRRPTGHRDTWRDISDPPRQPGSGQLRLRPRHPRRRDGGL
jgi:ATP-dependent 26S proteasome regulatory subunit